MYCGYITTLNGLRKHSNADRLQCCEVFGQNVIVDLSYYDGQQVVFFPSDGQLSEEFANDNNLVRKKDENGNNVGGYLDPIKRNVTAVRLRGEKSEGLVLPIEVLSKYVDVNTLKIGEQITVLNGHEICKKYIPRGNHRNRANGTGNKARKIKVDVAPLFMEHADTEQLLYNMDAFKDGDLVEITLKCHGTSQRTGYLPRVVEMKPNNLLAALGKNINPKQKLGKLKRKLSDYYINHCHPIYDWGYVTGTRRTVLNDFTGGYYGNDEFRKPHAEFFEGKLHKGETVYYEVVGFTTTGVPIMSDASNKKTNDKEFIKQYGDITRFSYGCSPDGTGEPTLYWDDEKTEPAVVPIVPQSDFYVYRMTMTNEDGDVVEYTPDYMRYRCEQMGAKCVPKFCSFFIEEPDDYTSEWNPGEYVKLRAEEFYDGADPIGKTHIREGVVVRIVNRPKFTAYKYKNFNFRVIEGIAKSDATAPDMEEAEELIKEEGN